MLIEQIFEKWRYWSYRNVVFLMNKMGLLYEKGNDILRRICAVLHFAETRSMKVNFNLRFSRRVAAHRNSLNSALHEKYIVFDVENESMLLVSGYRYSQPTVRNLIYGDELSNTHIYPNVEIRFLDGQPADSRLSLIRRFRFLARVHARRLF